MEAIPFYKRAVELDPDFAHAYSVLSAVYSGTGRPGLAAEYAEKGYALRDRVSEFEKLRITNFYHGFATGDLNKRIEVLMLLKRTYPREMAGAPTDLALTYIQIGQFDQAVAQARESIRLNPNFAPAHRALAWALLRLNRFAEAKDALTQALQQKLDSPAFSHLSCTRLPSSTATRQECSSSLIGRAGNRMNTSRSTGKPAQRPSPGSGAGRKSCHAARLTWPRAARRKKSPRAMRQSRRCGAPVLRRLPAEAGAETRAQRALKLARGRASLPRAALALALCGRGGSGEAAR